MHRRTFLTAGTAAFTLGSLRDASAQLPAAIRIVGPPNDSYKSVMYGVRAGIFQKYGLTVETSFVTSGAAAGIALTGGAADVALTNVAVVIQAHGKGIPMTILSPATLYTSSRATTVMVVLKDSPIRSGADMDGKVIGTVAVDGLNAASLQAWIDQHGGNSRNFKMLEVPGSLGLQALEQGRVDVVVLSEPALSEALESGKVRVFGQPLDSIASHFELSAFAVMQPYADANGDSMRRFALAVHEAQAYTNAHLPETVKLVAEYSKIPPDVIARSVRMVDPQDVDVKNLQPLIDVMAKYGMIDKPFPAKDIISSLAVAAPHGR